MQTGCQGVLCDAQCASLLFETIGLRRLEPAGQLHCCSRLASTSSAASGPTRSKERVSAVFPMFPESGKAVAVAARLKDFPVIDRSDRRVVPPISARRAPTRRRDTQSRRPGSADPCRPDGKRRQQVSNPGALTGKGVTFK